MRSPVTIDKTGSDNPAGLSPEEASQLKGGGQIGNTKWLYPYDGTVFPRDAIAPLVMWQSDEPADAVYLHMHSRLFTYKSILRPTLEGALFTPSVKDVVSAGLGIVAAVAGSVAGTPQAQLAIPQEAWDAAGRQFGGHDDVLSLELTLRTGGRVIGPITSQVKIANASIKGSLYYNQCMSQTGTAFFGIGGQVMRIPSGGTAEVITASTECVGCHSVSANGSRMVAQLYKYPDLNVIANGQPQESAFAAMYSFGVDGKPESNDPKSAGKYGAFGALYPDGSTYLTTTGDILISQAFARYLPPQSTPATLYDLSTGMIVPDNGIPGGAGMPMFSPDGRYLVFTDNAINGARGLAVMDYDPAARKASGYRVLVEEAADSSRRPGWPFLLPDNKGVIFTRTTGIDFAAGLYGGWEAALGANISNLQGMTSTTRVQAVNNKSDLYIADVATGKVTILAKAMGYLTPADADADETYLPFGKEDQHGNYFPTVSPVAAGGYFWVFFDSLRHFGSLGSMRLLWGFAVDVQPDGNYAIDPSHPPFYVSGQEFIASTHHRAFAALDTCRPDGDQCRTGIDCCSGACSLPQDSDLEASEPVGTCGQPPPTRGCALRDERCNTAADCCDNSNYCINGFCAFVELL